MLHLDYETFSSVDLKSCGLYKYAESDDFEVLLMSYSVDGSPVRIIDLANGEKIPREVLSAFSDESVTKWAHNSAFERVCTSRLLGLPRGAYLSPRNWRCSMISCAYLGLPLSLADAGAVLGLDKQKLTEGKELIRHFCSPPKHKPQMTIMGTDDRWEQFKAYCIRDTEVEMRIQAKLAKFPLPDWLWEEFWLDQTINDRGVLLDMPLVRKAIAISQKSKADLLAQMQEITELKNPNSVSQMKDWLAENGLEMETLGKKAVAETLKTCGNKQLSRVLELRQKAAKSSVKKYQAMDNYASADNRARGLFQFYGASRTGREAGRGVQLQNLPQNHIPDLEQARELVKSGDIGTLAARYGNVQQTLSELIRTALIPKKGCKFIVADYSSIEAVTLGWLAGEQWVLDAYAAKKDLYIATASQMFHVPAEKIDKKDPLRQKGKIAVLACIAEGQPVLTNKGLVPIENVTVEHKLWDGEEWVTHEGVVYKGEKEAIEYDGLQATPDHIVWAEDSSGQQRQIRFGDAAARHLHLVQSGKGGRAIRVGGNNRPKNNLYKRNGSKATFSLQSMPLHGLRRREVDKQTQSQERTFKGLSKLFGTRTATPLMARQALNSSKTEMRESERHSIPQLWRTRDKVRVCECNGGGALLDRNVWASEPQYGNRQGGQQRQLREGQHSLCYTLGELLQQAGHSFNTVVSRVLAICKAGRSSQIITRLIKKRSYSGRGNSSIRETQKLAVNIGKVRLYDIRNAGRHHRFTVSGKLVHNCGYGGSVGALKAFGAIEMGLTEETLQEIVNAWRKANPNIVRMWYAFEKAAITAVADRTTEKTHGITFTQASKVLFIELPSGRRLAYAKPKLKTNRYGRDALTYEGTGDSKRWERMETYSGKIAENINQAIARDVLFAAMRRVSAKGYDIVASVHDEIVCEVPDSVTVDEICAIMAEPPEWASDLHLRAAGFETPFYKKD